MEVETMPGLPVSILNQLSARLLAGLMALVPLLAPVVARRTR